MPDTIEITFNLDIDSTDKTRDIVNNEGKAMLEKKVLMLRSKEIDTINKADIYDTYKDLYISEKEREEKLLQGLHSTKWFNGLCCTITITAKNNAIKKTFEKGLQCLWILIF